MQTNCKSVSSKRNVVLEFFDLKQLNDKIGNIKSSRKVNDDKLSNMHIIKSEREAPFQILYKTSYAQDEFCELKIKRPRVTINYGNLILEPLYKNKIKISDKKKKGLMELLKKTYSYMSC